jgi:hypothetical protein
MQPYLRPLGHGFYVNYVKLYIGCLVLFNRHASSGGACRGTKQTKGYCIAISMYATNGTSKRASLAKGKAGSYESKEQVKCASKEGPKNGASCLWSVEEPQGLSGQSLRGESELAMS